MLQFGGAVGTLAALGEKGLDVAERLAASLDLPLPEAPWHTDHDRSAEVASAFAILAGTCGKIARDIALLMQTDVAEAFEPAAPGRGGSSTMPHKRNPIAAAAGVASRKASTAKRDLQDVLGEDQRVKLNLSVGELARLFEPAHYQGTAQNLIDRIIASLQGRSVRR